MRMLESESRIPFSMKILFLNSAAGGKRFTAISLFIWLSLVIFAPADADPSVYVVKDDNAEFFYHQDGIPTGLGKIPVGTEITVDSINGERCYFVYNGKPAYIQRRFLNSQVGYLAEQEHVRMLAEEAKKQQEAKQHALEQHREQERKHQAELKEQQRQEQARQEAARLQVQKEQEAARLQAQREQEQFEASQQAKGLVKFGDQWMTPAQVQTALAEQKELRIKQLKAALELTNQKIAQNMTAAQQVATVPMQSLMATAMNGGSQWTDKYNADNKARADEYLRLKNEKASIETELALLGDEAGKKQLDERQKRRDPRFVADAFVDQCKREGTVKSSVYVTTTPSPGGCCVIYQWDYITRSGLRRESQYVIQMRKDDNGEWFVFDFTPMGGGSR